MSYIKTKNNTRKEVSQGTVPLPLDCKARDTELYLEPILRGLSPGTAV